MIYILSIFLFISSPIFAITFGPLEFDLPDQQWKVEKRVGNALCYIPKDQTESSKDLYSVALQAYSKDFDPFALEKDLNEQFPDMQTNVTILERTENNILYEWSAEWTARLLNKKVKNYALIRVFSTDSWTVELMYLTGPHLNHIDVSTIRSLWLPVLTKAKLN